MKSVVHSVPNAAIAMEGGFLNSRQDFSTCTMRETILRILFLS